MQYLDLTQQIVTLLKQRILDGELLCGQRVLASELVEELVVSDIIVDAYCKKMLTEWYQRLDHQAQII